MNGTFTYILLAAIGGLLSLVQILFGFLLKAHKDSDKDAHNSMMEANILRDDAKVKAINRIEIRVEQISKRTHDLTALVGKVDQWQRFHDKDRG
jgi:3-methyladenine DNA glycosylase Tag